MSGLIGGIFGNVGGSSAKRDREEQLNAFTNLRNVYNYAMPFAKESERMGRAETGIGTSDLGTAGGFFRNITSGDRSRALQAVAPEANAATAAADAQKRQEAALGTARGGGAVGYNQQRNAALQAQIDNMLFGARTGAAQALAGIGGTEAQIGLGQTGQALGAAGLGERSAEELGQQALYSRGLSEKIHQQHVKQLSDAFTDLLSAFIPGGGGLKGLLGIGGGGGTGGGGGGGGETGFGFGV